MVKFWEVQQKLAEETNHSNQNEEYEIQYNIQGVEVFLLYNTSIVILYYN